MVYIKMVYLLFYWTGIGRGLFLLEKIRDRKKK
jgi:hypothetical protein